MASIGEVQTNDGSVLDTPQEDSPREQLYKVLVIGDFGVGKTSIIRRYTENVFSPNYKLTIGVDFSLKTLQWADETKISLQLWDIAGHERFWHMTRVYYRYAIAAIVVFDLTRQVTFDSVLRWLSDVNENVLLDNGHPVPVLLLANKDDADNGQVDTSKLDDFCSKYDIAGWFATSAKENTNITEAMHFIVERILELASRRLEETENEDFTDLGLENMDQESSTTVSTHSSKYGLHGGSYSSASNKRLIGLVPNDSSDKPPNSCSC